MINLEFLISTMRAMMVLEERMPVLAQALKQMPASEDEMRSASIATDGKEIVVNPTFLGRHTEEERVYMLAFIAMMIVSDMHAQRGDRNAEIWSTACNMSIHLALQEQGVTGRPADADALYDPALAGLTADEIHDRLMDGRKKILGKQLRDLIANRKLDGTQPLLVPEGMRDIPPIDFKRGDYGYSHAQLDAAFDMVKNADHWKNPIDALIDADMMDVLAEAIPYFTGTAADFFEVDGQPDKLHVVAPGYYAGPCN